MEDKKKMNILIFSWRGPGHPNAGGAEESTHQHAKRWVKAGHNVTLFTSYYKDAEKNKVINGVNIIREGEQTFGVRLKAFWWYLFGQHPNYDLIIDEFHGLPFFTPLYIRSKKMGFIHEATKEVWKFNPWFKPFNLIPWILGIFFESSIFRFFYYDIPFMTVSESTKKDLMTWGIRESNIRVVHNGVTYINPKKSVKKEKTKTLIFLGALSRDKGIEEALTVFSGILDESREKWQFWVVGRGNPDYVDYLLKRSKAVKIERNIKFFGYVSEQKKFELLARAHLLVNTSVREGWGLVVTEAAAVGTPSVAFNVPGLRDSIKNGITGVVMDERSPKKMSRIIIDLLNSFHKYNKMCKEASRWGKSFSWERSSKESLRLIKEIIS